MIPLRDENPTRIFPVMTWTIIALCTVIWLMQVAGGMTESRGGLAGPLAGWTMIPAEITQGQDYRVNGPTLQPFFLTIFTSMFLHGGLLHLAGNMIFLYIFGNNIEDALGHAKYVVFYLVCGVIAAVTQIASSPDSTIPTLGASGAVAGVLGGYFLLYPNARVVTLAFLGFLVTTVRVPAWLLLGFWIISQFFSQWTQSLKAEMTGVESGGVAYFAHIGGFIAGMLLIRLFGGRPHDRQPYDDGRGPVFRTVNNPYRRPY